MYHPCWYTNQVIIPKASLAKSLWISISIWKSQIEIRIRQIAARLHYLATVPDISHLHIRPQSPNHEGTLNISSSFLFKSSNIQLLSSFKLPNQRRNPTFSTGDGKSFRKHTIIAYQSSSDQLIINFLKLSYSAIHNSTRLMMLANIIFHAPFLIFGSLSKCISIEEIAEIWEAMQLMLILFLFLSLKGLQRRPDLLIFVTIAESASTNWFQTIVKLKWNLF